MSVDSEIPAAALAELQGAISASSARAVDLG
jgi:hypothetical protein